MGSCNDNRNSFWALDKLDKIGISIILITFAIFSVSSCFATENVEMQEVQGVYVRTGSNFFVPGTNPDFGTSYFEVEPGYIYTVTPTSSAGGITLAFGYDVPALNIPYYEQVSLTGSDTYSFIVPYDFQYVYFYGSWSTFFTVTKERVGGMDNTVELLAQSITPQLIWDRFEIAVPYILIVVLVSFGFYLIFHAIREVSKGRDV